MVRTQIQLRENQVEYIKSVAAEEDISMAEVIRQAVELLQETREKPTKQELMLRSLEVFGKYSSAESDISINHDKYLAEVYGTW
jgi:Arc/MetJ-type ribon-helix-helix transcriptional regulator